MLNLCSQKIALIAATGALMMEMRSVRVVRFMQPCVFLQFYSLEWSWWISTPKENQENPDKSAPSFSFFTLHIMYFCDHIYLVFSMSYQSYSLLFSLFMSYETFHILNSWKYPSRFIVFPLPFRYSAHGINFCVYLR